MFGSFITVTEGYFAAEPAVAVDPSADVKAISLPSGLKSCGTLLLATTNLADTLKTPSTITPEITPVIVLIRIVPAIKSPPMSCAIAEFNAPATAPAVAGSNNVSGGEIITTPAAASP